MRGEHWRVEARPSEPVVHPLHQRANRLWICDIGLRWHDRRTDIWRTSPSRRMAIGFGPWRDTAVEFILFASEAEGARRIQSAAHDKVPLLAHPQVLLVPTHDSIPDLVHLRFFGVFLRHLLQRVA